MKSYLPSSDGSRLDRIVNSHCLDPVLEAGPLVEILGGAAYEGMPKARTATLLLMVDPDGTVKARLSERNSGCDLWVSGGSLGDVLAALDASLASGAPPWRRSQYLGGGRAQKGERPVLDRGRE